MCICVWSSGRGNMIEYVLRYNSKEQNPFRWKTRILKGWDFKSCRWRWVFFAKLRRIEIEVVFVASALMMTLNSCCRFLFCLSTCMSVYPLVRLFFLLFTYPSVYSLYVCLSACLLVYPLVHPSEIFEACFIWRYIRRDPSKHDIPFVLPKKISFIFKRDPNQRKLLTGGLKNLGFDLSMSAVQSLM